MNRTRPTFVGLLLALSLIVTAASSAAAAPDTHPFDFFIEGATDPCTGDSVDVTVTGTLRENLVVTASGQVLLQVHIEGTFVATNGRTGTVRQRLVVADHDPGGADYVERLTVRWHSNDQGTVAMTRIRLIVRMTPDGPTVNLLEEEAACRGR